MEFTEEKLLYLPEKTNFIKLPIVWNSIYIRSKEGLFYVKKMERKISPIFLVDKHSEQLEKFDEHFGINSLAYQIRRQLSVKDLGCVTSITEHTHKNELHEFMLKFNVQRPENEVNNILTWGIICIQRSLDKLRFDPDKKDKRALLKKISAVAKKCLKTPKDNASFRVLNTLLNKFMVYGLETINAIVPESFSEDHYITRLMKHCPGISPITTQVKADLKLLQESSASAITRLLDDEVPHKGKIVQQTIIEVIAGLYKEVCSKFPINNFEYSRSKRKEKCSGEFYDFFQYLNEKIIEKLNISPEYLCYQEPVKLGAKIQSLLSNTIISEDINR